jgi:endonuclease/exonuclease/phosphatase family metal-dependent hydrolase
MLELMTLNLANYDDHPDWPQRIQIIVDTILSGQPDVIAVQEVRFDPGQPTTQASYQGMAEQIVYLLNQSTAYAGLSIVSQPFMFYPDAACHYPAPPPDDRLWEGLAILTRLPVTDTGAVFLTKTGTDGNLRGTQYAAVTTPSGTFYVFNTHFGLDETDRCSNAQQTLAYMSRFDGPQLLLGDLNAIPGDPALEILTKGGLTDLWASLQPNANGYTYPSSAPAKRIDYAWANDTARPSAQAIQLVATQPVEGIYASDHLGLLVTVAD